MRSIPIFLVFLLPLALCAPSADLDPEDNDSLETFEEHFNKPEITDPIENARRKAALKKAEKIVKKENKKFEKGKKTWFDAINKDSDLPPDEFKAEKTGDIIPPKYGRGLLEPTGNKEYKRLRKKHEIYQDLTELTLSPSAILLSFVTP